MKQNLILLELNCEMSKYHKVAAATQNKRCSLLKASGLQKHESSRRRRSNAIYFSRSA